MGQRSDLHLILKGITPNVYFQPPPSVYLEYPCIVYRRIRVKTKYAANLPYTLDQAYVVTVIDRDAESPIPRQVAALKTASFESSFQADELYHDVYNLFF